MSDFTSNELGVIGDSADKRFTFRRTDGKINDPTPPDDIQIIDWQAANRIFLPGVPSPQPKAPLGHHVLLRKP